MIPGGDPESIADERPLRILHVMRSPIGGLFRHVLDLSRAQARCGHAVGVVADSSTGGDDAAAALRDMEPQLALGVTRLPMRRLPCPDDLLVAWRIARLARSLSPDVIHGHGAKGGLYARLPAFRLGFPAPHPPAARVYTPHGGSLHFRPGTAGGAIFFTAERIMARVTDFIPFESDYARRRFQETVGPPPALSTVVHNGLSGDEFAPVATAADAADFVFIGEMRHAKGVADLLHAFAMLPSDLRLALIGSGQDEESFRALAEKLDLSQRARFLPRMATREALSMGRILVVPSRIESLPYIVLEAIAARRPVVAADVGGMPEIFGRRAHRLAPARDPKALAAAMQAMRAMDAAARDALLEDLAASAAERFTIDKMNAGIDRKSVV